ncbi:hypothetical protein [Cellulosimicrobium arenosum]|uniref:Uncharacterized protein n=1 Tax=Cellulosimicrobium arenosum TaxID=2708133 RepID=A0A927IYS8_9MICO|nr:hypothetical protein [Cellulosimicrobium arenosum]MBD8077694.1 hypothetical protein [Cellulosimicrobium arenosum]
MSARTQIVAFLTEALPAEWTVLPFARDLGNLTKPTVSVEMSRVDQGPSQGLWSATCTITLVAPFQDYEAAEDFLEDGLLVTLGVLDGIPNIGLGAERVVIAEKHHAYQVNITYPLAKSDDSEE